MKQWLQGFLIILGIALFPSSYAITVIVPNGVYLSAGANYGRMLIKGIVLRPTTWNYISYAGRSWKARNLAGFHVGAGYAFSQLPLRFDIVYTKRAKFKFDLNPVATNSSAPTAMNSDLKEQDLMANFYFDWHWKYTQWVYPFAYLGIGLVQNETESKFTRTGYNESVNAKRGSFAWQGGLGLSFKITDHFYTDLAVQYANLGEATWGPWTNGVDGPMTLKTSDIAVAEAILTLHVFFGNQESRLPPSLIGDEALSKSPSLIDD